MAIDSKAKRFSMMALRCQALRGIALPLFPPDGNIDLGDRQHMLGCYTGVEFHRHVPAVAKTPDVAMPLRKSLIGNRDTMVRKYA